jgi:hypothetical protein
MTETLEQQVSEVLKTAPLAAPSTRLSGERLEIMARSRLRRRRSVAGVAAVAVTSVLVTTGVGLAQRTGADSQAPASQATTQVGPPTEHPPTTRCFCGPAPILPSLDMLGPRDREGDPYIDAVVGKPITVRATLDLGHSLVPLRWIQFFVSYPQSLQGVPWSPGELTHQLQASQRLYGSEARQGQRLTLTWVPTKPGRYHVNQALRSGTGGSGVGVLGTIRVRPA